MRYRNVTILSICQALGFSGSSMVLLLGSIVGSSLAPSPAWATLPISMHVMDRYNLNDTKVVIQSHLIAMYVPSLATAFLLRRLGAFRLKLIGVASMATCLGLAVLGHGFVNYLIGLILMGFGWNLLFVGATVLLTQSYRPAERFQAQAINDLAVFSVLALASLVAGPVIARTSWEVLNLIGLPILLLTAILILLAGRETAQRP